MDTAKPRLAITMGDAAGVGPEVIAAAWNFAQLHQTCSPLVIGDADVMRRACQLRTSGNVHVQEIATGVEAAASRERMPVLSPSAAPGREKSSTPVDTRDLAEVRPGTIDSTAGAAAYEAICAAAQLALAGEVDGIVTAPINKKSFREAGIEFPGHTELFAQMCGVNKFAMMLYRPFTASRPGQEQEGPTLQPSGLGVAHVTLHVALRDVFAQLTEDEIVEKAGLLHGMLSDLHGRAPRLGIAALNPHGGEAGLFGREEIEIISPAVERARANGMNVRGPIPADTLFRHAAAGDYDGVVAMYHDQGHIALKLLGMHDVVNVTLGLPIVRTSVAHGTGFDIAWQGTAAPESLLQAIDVAARLASPPSNKPRMR
ncbi:MAG: 4-hydroxythreonine-4-phosphate dehydrogenase PdxA [Pirellulales bacterium]|nr:4-hydroxythreonine-4-phosphate dehydrogenase PdxA [Pirellulales bacterium]